MTIGKLQKLVPNLNNKTKYVLYHEMLKFVLSKGIKLTKIYPGLKFSERAWLEPYISKNTGLRQEFTTEDKKSFFKLTNNSYFGKTMENVRKT
jgi:hypothetical protein